MGVGRAVALAGLGRGIRGASEALTRGRIREDERKEREDLKRRQRLASVADIVAAGGRVGGDASADVPETQIGELDGQPVFLPRDGMTPATRAVDRRQRERETAEAEQERTAYQERYDALEGLPDAQRRAIARNRTTFDQYLTSTRRPEEETPAARLRRIEDETRVRERVRDEFEDDDDQPTPAQRRTSRNQAASGFRSNAVATTQTANAVRDPDPKDFGYEGAVGGWVPEGGPRGTQRDFPRAQRQAIDARESGLFQAGRQRYSADSTMRAQRHEESTGEDPDGSLDFEISEARRGIQEANRLREAAKRRNPAAEPTANRLFREAVAEIRNGLSPEARRVLGNYGNLTK